MTKQLCRLLGVGPLLRSKQAGTNLGRSVITVPGQVYWVRAPGYRRETGREEAAFQTTGWDVRKKTNAG